MGDVWLSDDAALLLDSEGTRLAQYETGACPRTLRLTDQLAEFPPELRVPALYVTQRECPEGSFEIHHSDFAKTPGALGPSRSCPSMKHPRFLFPDRKRDLPPRT